MNESILIATPDTLHAIALRNILIEYFGINPVECKDFSQNSMHENMDYYFVDANVFNNNLEFFIPRRSRTRILSESTNIEGVLLGVHAAENEIIDAIEQIISDIKKRTTPISSNLTSREIDVLKLVVSGMTNKEIADRLCISFNTVLSHRKNISSKLGIRSASGLGVYAMMNGYI